MTGENREHGAAKPRRGRTKTVAAPATVGGERRPNTEPLGNREGRAGRKDPQARRPAITGASRAHRSGCAGGTVIPSAVTTSIGVVAVEGPFGGKQRTFPHFLIP